MGVFNIGRYVRNLSVLLILCSGVLLANPQIGNPPLDCNQLGWLTNNTQNFLWFLSGRNESISVPTSLYRFKVTPPTGSIHSLPNDASAYIKALTSCFESKNNVIHAAYENHRNPNWSSEADRIVKYVKQFKQGDIKQYQKDLDRLNTHFDELITDFGKHQDKSKEYSYQQLSEDLESRYTKSTNFNNFISLYGNYKSHPSNEIRHLYEQNKAAINQKIDLLNKLLLMFREQAKLEKKLSEYNKENDFNSIVSLTKQQEVKQGINLLLKDIKSEKVKKSVGKLAIEQADKGIEQFVIMIIMSIVVIFTALGTILGLVRKAPVYYDFDDLAYSAGVFAWPVAISLFMLMIPIPSILANIVIFGPALFLFYKVVVATWNVGPKWLLPIILVTKVVWALMLVSAILMAMNPSGKTRQARRNKRTLAVFFLAVSAPVISKLIVHKRGRVFNPNVLEVTGVRGMSRVGKALRG